MENASEYFYSQLADTKNPGLVLNKMFNELFGTKTDINRIKTFNKLVRLYGRFEVYFALLDMANWNNDGDKFQDKSNPYPLIARFIINRLEKKYQSRSDSYGKDLEPFARKIDKLIKNLEKEKPEMPITFHNGDTD
jgi:hypothetical protein